MAGLQFRVPIRVKRHILQESIGFDGYFFAWSPLSMERTAPGGFARLVVFIHWGKEGSNAAVKHEYRLPGKGRAIVLADPLTDKYPACRDPGPARRAQQPPRAQIPGQLEAANKGAFMVSVGKRIADFNLPATGDKNLTPEDFKGSRLVLYFYPKDHTPGCTRESQDFRDSLKAFAAAGTTIVGVSRDSVRTHENFRSKQGLPFDLIADTEEILCRQFDVIKQKKLYGREYMGIERSTFLIDEDGVLQAEWRKVKVPGHVEEVLEKARSLD